MSARRSSFMFPSGSNAASQQGIALPYVTRYMATFGAVAIEGPKWSGKTWMGRNHANAMVRLDAPGEGEALRQLAHAAPETLLTSFDLPLLIDEWQEQTLRNVENAYNIISYYYLTFMIYFTFDIIIKYNLPRIC